MARSLLSRASIALTAALAAPFLLGATSPGSAVALPAVDSSHLRVVVETTSDWTSVAISPGWIASRTPAVSTDGLAVTEDPKGWTLRSGTGTYQAMSADVVVAELDGAPEFRIQTRKGWTGVTQVTVYDLDEGGVERFRAMNQVQSTTDPTNAFGWDVARDDLLGTVPLALPKADASKKVLAFYYPWFDKTYTDPNLGDQPLDRRSTWRGSDVVSMTAQAAGAGVDGFVVSWRGTPDAAGLDLAVNAAAAQGQVVSAYLETRNTGGGTVTADGVYDAIAALESRFDSPAWLRTDGVPVIFAFEMGLLGPAGWRIVHERLALAGIELRIVGDAHAVNFDDLHDGLHHYAPVASAQDTALYGRRQAIEARADVVTGIADAPQLWAATVAPGFDDTHFRSPGTFVDREGGARYDAMWDAAVVTDPDYVLITSWNEWYETSSIEPSVLFGDLALRQTAERAAGWAGTSTASATTEPAPTASEPTKTKGPGKAVGRNR